MFKSWRNDKKKIKAVFKLQFQATQVPKLKKPALIISLVPEDVGKTTFKLEKTAVQDGTCTWEKPIYVTVKLIKELKTAKLHEKIYSFIVSSGSSKSGYLGEASIDFADFAEETEPLTVSLPLKFANSGAVLNVTIQRMKEGTDQRDIEDNENPILSPDTSLKSQLSNDLIDGDDEFFADDGELDNLLMQNAEQDGSFKASIDSNASFRSTVRQNSIPQRRTEEATARKNNVHRISSRDWSVGSTSDGSLVDSTNSPEDNLPRELREASDETIENLKSEISSLLRQSTLSELELQSLRKQVTKENKRAQDLSRQIVDLKEERDALKVESEQLKSSQKCLDRKDLNLLQAKNEDLQAQLEENRLEISHERELKTNLQLQLQRTQDSNSELILAISDLEEVLEQKNIEITGLASKLEFSKKANEVQVKRCKCNMKEVEDQHALHALEETTRKKNDASELYILKKKMADLSDELEAYREDREKLEKYLEQLNQDYEDLKQENHYFSSKLEQSQIQELKKEKELSELKETIKELELQVERLEDKLKKQTLELSESLDSTNELESQVKGLEKELEKQAQEQLEKETMNEKLLSELESLRAQDIELKNNLSKEELEKETLQQQVLQLKVELQKKEKENTSKEQLMYKNGKCRYSDAKKSNLTEERNQVMEAELKEMQERYSELSLKFAEVEGERQQLVMTVRNLRNGKKN